MEEIIARRKNSLGIGYIAMAVIGVVLGVFCVVLGILNDTVGAIYIGVAVGLILVFAGVLMAVIFYRSPKNIIVYEGGVLHLGKDLTCSPLDVTGCKVIVTRRNGIVDRWGKLEITLADGRKVVLNYVDYVESVQARLGSLKAEVYDEMMRRQEAQNTDMGEPPADPFGV